MALVLLELAASRASSSLHPAFVLRWLYNGAGRYRHGRNMADIERISVEQAHRKANQALLVCAYEDEAKYRRVNLQGSISLASFQSRAASLPKTQVIIFY